jgi:hypothetical protein
MQPASPSQWPLVRVEEEHDEQPPYIRQDSVRAGALQSPRVSPSPRHSASLKLYIPFANEHNYDPTVWSNAVLTGSRSPGMALTPPATSETPMRQGPVASPNHTTTPAEVVAAASPFELLVHEHEQWIPAWLPLVAALDIPELCF